MDSHYGLVPLKKTRKAVRPSAVSWQEQSESKVNGLLNHVPGLTRPHLPGQVHKPQALGSVSSVPSFRSVENQISPVTPTWPAADPPALSPPAPPAPWSASDPEALGAWLLGGLGLGYGGLGYGYGIGGPAETSASLGTLEGVIPSCINQIPASEVVIQPPPCVVTIPGPILSASCEPTAVGGNTPCAVGGSGIAYRRGLWSPSLFGGYLGGRPNICLPPC
ncbi:hypothetical protein lerEdw1_015467 [Lerista edwardsae]|nr:hypothetical protein lerEdw1_015467 [Lerista edwardsae]